MEFTEFKVYMQTHVEKMMKKDNCLCLVEVDKDEMWNHYLDSFPEGTNEIYRERREYDCSCCRSYIKNIGNLVWIKNNQITTIWDIESLEDDVFSIVCEKMGQFVRSKPILGVFITKEPSFGIDKNRELLEDGSVKTWEHFYVKTPRHRIWSGRDTIGGVRGEATANAHVFRRTLTEISRDSIETVLELISQKSLYKGEEWEKPLTELLRIHKKFHELPYDRQRELFIWEQSVRLRPAMSRIKNHSIGVLLIDISEGIDLNQAVKRYENIVAPTNYKRPKAIFTKKMVEQAQQTIEELGLTDSLPRRHAIIEDITVNNILFANRDSVKKMSGDVFGDLMKDAKKSTGKFDRLEEVTIDHFVKDVLPNISEMEILLKNDHASNMVSLIAPRNPDAPSMFKWNNGFSWAYTGNITDSSMKERVKSLGGDVTGVLRFSIQWNDGDNNQNDFDAHCIEPNGNQIYYSNKTSPSTTGKLDIDIINPGNNVAVENITWSDITKMKEGEYHFFVHNFSHKGGRTGFTAEIEFDGTIYSYSYDKELRQSEEVTVAKIQFSQKDGIKFIKSLDSTESTREIWGLSTNEFHPVSVMMYSPNYWDDQDGIGHRHYFFMLNGCINDTRPNGFFNEFLRSDLEKHKRVFEALGSKMRVEDSIHQLSGVGFSSTKRNELVCRVKGNFERTLKLQF